MASVISQQYACNFYINKFLQRFSRLNFITNLDRAQKSLGLVGGAPNYDPLEGFTAPEGTARTWKYSADGSLWVCALPTWWVWLLLTPRGLLRCWYRLSVQIYQTTDSKLLLELPVPNIHELGISPRSNFLSTWERPGKYLCSMLSFVDSPISCFENLQ
jgi:hypothetical protein